LSTAISRSCYNIATAIVPVENNYISYRRYQYRQDIWTGKLSIQILPLYNIKDFYTTGTIDITYFDSLEYC
jgi:hypothetical protein